MPDAPRFGLLVRTLLVGALVQAYALGYGAAPLRAQEEASDYSALLAQYERGQTEEAVQALAAHEDRKSVV